MRDGVDSDCLLRGFVMIEKVIRKPAHSIHSKILINGLETLRSFLDFLKSGFHSRDKFVPQTENSLGVSECLAIFLQGRRCEAGPHRMADSSSRII